MFITFLLGLPALFDAYSAEIVFPSAGQVGELSVVAEDDIFTAAL